VPQSAAQVPGCAFLGATTAARPQARSQKPQAASAAMGAITVPPPRATGWGRPIPGASPVL